MPLYTAAGGSFVFGLGWGEPALLFEWALIQKEGQVHGSIRLDLSSKWPKLGAG